MQITLQILTIAEPLVKSIMSVFSRWPSKGVQRVDSDASKESVSDSIVFECFYMLCHTGLSGLNSSNPFWPGTFAKSPKPTD